MTECQEIARSIWRARSSSYGNGLNVTMPIRTRADAARVAAHYCGDAGRTVIANVADELAKLAGVQ